MDSDLTIVFLGKAGAGKSASGNTILGRPALESRLSFTPVTKEICERTGRVFGKQIRVIDTPGILDTEDTEREIKIFCEDLIGSSRPCLFLVVIRVGRFTKEEQEAVEAAMRVLGRKGIRKSYVLFTHGDALKSMKLEDFIFGQEDDSLPDVVNKFAAGYHLFNNESTDEEQVRNLLLKAGYLRTDVPDVPDVPVEKRRIILLGRPGVGKSSSGNTILGSDWFTSSCAFNSVTEECVSESAKVEGRQVTVVDTPGFTDKVLAPEELHLEIMKSIVEASPGPHAFVIVVKLGRVSEGDKKLFEILPQLFGSAEASKYTMVLFTHGDGLKGHSMDEMIQSNQQVSDLVSMCGGRYCVFDNNQSENRLQVRRFLDTVDQMVSENGGEHYSSDLFRVAETFIREEMNKAAEEKKKAAEEMNKASEEKNKAGQGATEDKWNIVLCIRRAWERFKEHVMRWWKKKKKGTSQGGTDSAHEEKVDVPDTEQLIP